MPQSESKEGAGKKAPNLSHVPCKFYRVGSCTAGAACPFSHGSNGGDGEGGGGGGGERGVCAWFVKGNCKFGHKCALAHVLPGQGMGMDRKNKKAAQVAARREREGGNVNRERDRDRDSKDKTTEGRDREGKDRERPRDRKPPMPMKLPLMKAAAPPETIALDVGGELTSAKTTPPASSPSDEEVILPSPQPKIDYGPIGSPPRRKEDFDDPSSFLPSSLTDLLTPEERMRRYDAPAFSSSVPLPSLMAQRATNNIWTSSPPYYHLSPSNASAAFLSKSPFQKQPFQQQQQSPVPEYDYREYTSTSLHAPIGGGGTSPIPQSLPPGLGFSRIHALPSPDWSSTGTGSPGGAWGSVGVGSGLSMNSASGLSAAMGSMALRSPPILSRLGSSSLRSEDDDLFDMDR